jgi:hypothetical protein
VSSVEARRKLDVRLVLYPPIEHPPAEIRQPVQPRYAAVEPNQSRSIEQKRKKPSDRPERGEGRRSAEKIKCRTALDSGIPHP